MKRPPSLKVKVFRLFYRMLSGSDSGGIVILTDLQNSWGYDTKVSLTFTFGRRVEKMESGYMYLEGEFEDEWVG